MLRDGGGVICSATQCQVRLRCSFQQLAACLVRGGPAGFGQSYRVVVIVVIVVIIVIVVIEITIAVIIVIYSNI